LGSFFEKLQMYIAQIFVLHKLCINDDKNGLG
jgi:hypothetical protein